jgi:hypothetical protein
MHSRRLAATTAVLSLVLTLGLTSCAQQVGGTPMAAEGALAAEQPTSTKTPARATSATPRGGTTKSGTPKAANVKITNKKKTTGYEDCALLTPADIEQTIGGKASGEKGCVQSTDSPAVVVLFMVTLGQTDGEAREVELGGNTAYQVTKGQGDCSVLVMLTDDPEEITPALLVSVTPIDEVDECDIALKLATKAFDKIPNA